MSKLRRDLLYVIIGFSVTFAVLGAVILFLATLYLMLLSFAPGRFSTFLKEMTPPDLHWAVLMGALLEGVYSALLMGGQFISKQHGRFLIVYSGAIALIALIVGLLLA
jgi:hypothetical protein